MKRHKKLTKEERRTDTVPVLKALTSARTKFSVTKEYIYIIHIYIYIFKHISSFGQIAQWLERVHGKHKVVGSNPTRANVLYGIEKP